MTLQVPRLPNLVVWPPTSQIRVTYPTTSSLVIRHPDLVITVSCWFHHCLRCSFPRGPRISSFRNRCFLGLRRGTRVKVGWHWERGSRFEIRDIDEREIRRVHLFPGLNSEDIWHIITKIPSITCEYRCNSDI